MARVTIVTDAWHPQINGAVTTLTNSTAELERQGHAVQIVEPSQFRNWRCPTYPEIRLARTTARELMQRIEASRPDYVLLSIEGPLGLAARRALIDAGIPFNTAMMTRFQDYLWHRFLVPRAATLRWLDWFHRPAGRILVPTATMQRALSGRGLVQARTWTPGIDRNAFRPRIGLATRLLAQLPRPIHLYVGRLAVEKNIAAFLALDLAGSKVVVGDGPLMRQLRQRHPRAHFLGYKSAEEIAEICTASDVMAFPSRTDTYGHVIVEALACGLPVAAFPVQGPMDILTDPSVGAMDEDLGRAIEKALHCDRAQCRAFVAGNFSWERSAQMLLANLVPTRSDPKVFADSETAA